MKDDSYWVFNGDTLISKDITEQEIIAFVKLYARLNYFEHNVYFTLKSSGGSYIKTISLNTTKTLSVKVKTYD